MKKLAFAGLALLVASSAAAQFGQGQGRPGDRDQGFGRGRGGFDRCGYDGRGRNYWNDLATQIQDVIQDAQDIQTLANQRFSSAESRTYNDGRVVDAYLSVGSLLGQAQATLTMTQANDWNNWDRYNSASDRFNVGQAVDNLERVTNAIRTNDQFGIYNSGRFGLGRRLDCDIQDLRKITDALNEEWRRGRPGQGGQFPGGPNRPGRPGGPGGPGGGNQRSDHGTAWVQVSVDRFLEVVIGPSGARVSQSDNDPQGRTQLLGGQVTTTDRRGDSFRNVRNVLVTPRRQGNNAFDRIAYSVTTNVRTGEITIRFDDALAGAGNDTFEVSWTFD